MSETKPAVTTANASKEITSMVLDKINHFQAANELKLPGDYSPENALKSAYLLLIEQKDRDNKPVLESCSRESIANALLDMVVQGLSPVKKQCYFIPYGGKLQLQRSYMGSIAVAKRIGGVKKLVANLIYTNDTFEFTIDPETGIRNITKHEQNFSNIDDNNIVGAYCTLQLDDGTKHVEIMTMKQIEQAWMQGATKGKSPAHMGFKGEMAKKTIINRACKLFINTSDDSGLYEEFEPDGDDKSNKVHADIKDNANKTDMSFDEHEEVKETTTVDDTKNQVVDATKNGTSVEMQF